MMLRASKMQTPFASDLGGDSARLHKILIIFAHNYCISTLLSLLKFIQLLLKPTTFVSE